MKIKIRTKGIEPDETLLAYVNRRAGFAFSRFADDITEADVLLQDVNGPRGGIDKQCKLVLHVRRHHEPIVVDTTHQDVLASVDICFDRASRTVSRTLDLRTDRMRANR